VKQKHFIDLSKGLTAVVILLLMAIYHRFESQTLWIYLALHGTYGALWVLKSRVFPDKQWEQKCSIFWGLYILGGLAFYWVAPWIIAGLDVQLPGWSLALSVSTFGFGVFLHFASDMQKHMFLKYQPQRLLKEGFWARNRNPNYLGELLIYLSFAWLSQHWIPFLILGLFVAIVWIPNMRRKDRSLSKYSDFEAYRKTSRWILPI